MATRAAVKQIFQALPYIRKVGAKQIWFDYDDEVDVFYVSFERPQKATDTDIMEDGTLLRLRGKRIVGMTITNFSKKFGGST